MLDAPYRELPRSLEAEQALLGAILVNNDAYERVSGLLEPHQFYDQLHGAIFEAAAKLIAAGRRADPITLKPYFEGAEPVGTTTVPIYLGQIAANATTIINVRDYARTIVDLATRRSLITIGEDMVNAAYDSPVDFPPKEQIEEAEKRLYKLTDSRSEPHVVHEADAVAAEIDRALEAHRKGAASIGLPTGLVDLDRRLGGGLQPSDLIVVAGRPGMGKTGLAGTVLHHIVVPAVFFSLEMTAAQIACRMISAETGIPAEQLRTGTFSAGKARELVEIVAGEGSMMRRIRERGVILDQTGGISIANLATRARRLKRQHRIELIIVDYIQLMQATTKGGNRVAEVTEITTGLKALAKELNVPVLALSQLSRKVEERTDKRPHLADLRESGSIEQDADVVLFVYRDEYYLERERPNRADDPKAYAERLAAWELKKAQAAGKAEIVISKYRHGPTGTVEVHFDAATTLFSNLARSGQAHDQP
jgi:replicative DNA helicase